MLFLINDILDFSQIESKSLILNYAHINLKAVLEYCFDILKFKADSKGIKLIIDEQPGNQQLDTISTDENRLKQIIINLLSNAIKYTEHGYVKLRFHEHPANDNLAIIEVQDTGVGIPEDKMQSLFEAFTKIMDNRDLNKDGVGLGLTISKNIATALGGDLDVESKYGFGSKFILTIPKEKPQKRN